MPAKRAFSSKYKNEFTKDQLQLVQSLCSVIADAWTTDFLVHIADGMFPNVSFDNEILDLPYNHPDKVEGLKMPHIIKIL